MAAAVWSLAAASMIVACGGDSDPAASAGEQRVCNAIQKIVDDLASERNTAALATLPELEIATMDSENGTMVEAGRRFFDDLFTDIDYTQLTFAETAELGRKYQATMAETLGELIDECVESGAPIARLPSE